MIEMMWFAEKARHVGGQRPDHPAALLLFRWPGDQVAIATELGHTQGTQPLAQTRVEQRGLAFRHRDTGFIVQQARDGLEIRCGQQELPIHHAAAAVCSDGAHAASASGRGRMRSSEIRLTMRPSMASRP